MRMSVSVLVILMALLAAPLSGDAYAQHTAPQSALDAALAQHVGSDDAQRESVQRALAHPDVQDVARELGIDLRRATSAVATLDGDELATLAAQATQVESALAGGQSSVTLSTTMIIIGLLVLILIIVAVS